MNTELKVTEDGSSTLYVPELNEHYHSIHGAIQESMHVFIEAGLRQVDLDSFRIFEMGLGTGLNCLLTFLNTPSKKIEYHAIEKYPVNADLVAKLNYPSLLKLDEDKKKIFSLIHQAECNKPVMLSPGFMLNKAVGDLNTYELPIKFDLIYYDAFAPDIQPELWTEEVFAKIAGMMNPGAVFVTYCAKGAVRRILHGCGLKTERIPGPPGKREMLRAWKRERN